MTKQVKVKKKYCFSGHETFSCRVYWPKKGFDFIINNNKFNSNDALVKLGVGKNMVPSIKHWLMSFNILENDEKINFFWNNILKDKGYDPYLENKGTLWLLHFFIVKTEYASSYNFVFNFYRKEKFEFVKSNLVKYIILHLELLQYKNFTNKTIEKDINVLLKNYCYSNTVNANIEDDLSSLLIDLELIEKSDFTGSSEQLYTFVVTDRNDIPWQVFLYALLDTFVNEVSVDLHSLQTYDNSPGLIFCMNKSGIIYKMQEVAENIVDVVYKNDAGIITLSGIDSLNKDLILEEYYEA
tara:strand:+ start:128 stop:1018 length:891 start_codon:yes stop_codon:yes gene_type:complete